MQPSGVHSILTIRSARNEIHRQANVTGNHQSYSDRAIELINIRSSLSGQADLLWPSELAGAKAAITQLLNDLAGAEGERVSSEIIATADPSSGLQLINAALSTSPTGILANMDDARKNRLVQSLENRRHDYATQIAEPLLQRAQRAEVSLDGARSVSGVITEANTAFTLFGERDRSSTEQQSPSDAMIL